MTQYYDPDGDAEWFPPYTPVDIKDPPSWEDTAPSEYEPPHFVNPLDSMPIATNKEDDWFTDKPEKKDETIHQKMYEIATAKYNPFAVGGSDNFQGGSENLTES